MPATRNLKILLGTAGAAIIVGVGTYAATQQELTIKQLENKPATIVTKIVEVTPTATPSATLNLKSINGKVVLPTGLTKIGTPASASKSAK